MSNDGSFRVDVSFWDKLTENQRDLIREGGYLYQEIFQDGKYSFSDYSFLVFPYAKCYEGYLKKLFLEKNYITQSEYQSNRLRLGRLITPDSDSIHESNRIYRLLENEHGKSIADMVWETWKHCRNDIFHYYPHNTKKVALYKAKEMIQLITKTMEELTKLLI
jgi:hypothetical protein